ncbi:MAG: alpha/beta hydrolase family protein [Fimbriimonadaceae bacterium]
MPTLAILTLGIVAQLPTSPIDFGRAEVARAAGARAADVRIDVRKGAAPESFTIDGAGRTVRIVGSDATGAMYGAFEFAERLRNEGEKAWSDKVRATPYLRQRGVNLFLTLPWDYIRNDTDDSDAALVDPKRWWFQDEHYWTTLLDLMAHSRLNWLDIHGMWDISVTDAPNLYAYFVTSQHFPKVGVPDSVKAADLKQLNHVIDMAHARGIKVSLMSYEARFHTPQNPNPPYKSTEENLYKYTQEVVEAMIRRTPKLDAIGFRIGESGHGASFFKCYTEAVKRSGRNIPLITRTWATRKRAVLPLARASKDFTAEIKYNGEQWAAPYIVVGGRMANWGSYSFEDYLSDSGPGHATRMWPGQAADGGGKWPSEPYKVVWQVRANGTHRIFPFYNPDWVRRTIKCMKVGTTSGYTVEGEDAYFPKDPLYYLANPADKYVDFIHQRDELYWMTWGRLGYDPTTPDATFDAVVKRWFEPTMSSRTGFMTSASGQAIADLWKRMSEIVPLTYMAHALGPDHRDDAPELETGDNDIAFGEVQPFDPLVFRPADAFWDDGRMSLAAFSAASLNYARADVARTLPSLQSVPAASRGRLKELSASLPMLGDLALYYSSRFAQTAYDAWRDGAALTSIETAKSPQLDFDRGAIHWWSELSDSPEANFYRPFTDRLRMHTNTFHWRQLLTSLHAEGIAHRQTHREVVAQSEFNRTWLGQLGEKPQAQLAWTPSGASVVVTLPALVTRNNPPRGSGEMGVAPQRPGPIGCGRPIESQADSYRTVATATLLYKPLPSSTFFHALPMKRKGDVFEVSLPRPNCGLCLASEVVMRDGFRWRIPSFFAGQTPYVVVPAKAGPTPPIYGSDEALRYLDPAILTPQNFGAIIVASRGARFFGFSKAQKRKLLEGVARGMKMLILQQDFMAKRYSLDFLPKPLKIEVDPTPAAFDPGGQLGLDKIQAKDIQWQKFAPSPGWDVFGSGGIARLKVGKGEVWVTSARFMQCAAARSTQNDLEQLLRAVNTRKPAILVDAGTESAIYTTSFWPDLMNYFGIPFLTLGEAIAQVQGIRSSKVITGPVADDDVLGGKGTSMANAFLRSQVVAAAKRPTAPNVAAFEALRQGRKRELLRCLGLDPMPPRTPLNARVTGEIPGDGYTLEKVVIESRPRFFVTMHVYVPAGRTGRLPVVMNVNGHWAHKKDEDRVQLRCMFEARQGYLAVAVDSPGFSFEGNSLIERRAEGDHNDFKLVEGGTNATGYYVWDTIRALDYVATRPDSDMSHVGITGASGGGLATLYTFAADDRYKAAVPVVYMASMELAPDNGCLCNHVPGTCQIGDRSDVIAIQAPKPVMLIGAQDDGEFPADATRLTQKKMAATWALFGKAGDTYVKIFPGGHDYSQGMREAMIGFFNRYVKGEGDGAPVAQPPLTALDPENRSILVLDPPAANERTMRELSTEYLDRAQAKVSAADAIAVNGGLPAKSDLKYAELSSGRRRVVVFDSEPGLRTPAILFLPSGKPKGVRIIADDAGKASSIGGRQADAMTGDGYAVLAVDILGTGELANIELRYPTYMGRSVAFTAGWQLVRAAEAMKRYSTNVVVVGRGPLASQAVMWAGLQKPEAFKHITGIGCLPDWQAVVSNSVPDVAVQPRAHLCGSLANLRKQVKNGEWR